MNKEQGLVLTGPHTRIGLSGTVSSLNPKRVSEVARGWPWEWSCSTQGQVSLTMPSLWLLTGVLRGGVGQHLLHQPDVRPGKPLGRRAARDPGCHEPHPDSRGHL